MPDRQKDRQAGYPSIDKPWLKYYSEEAITAALPECKYTDLIWECNKDRLEKDALEFLGNRITYGSFFQQIDQVAKGLISIGVKPGERITIFSINTPETLFFVFALNKLGAIPCLEYVTESQDEAVNAVNHYRSKVVVVLDMLLSRFNEIADIETVQHMVILPFSRSLPFSKRAIIKFKTEKIHCQKELSYSELLASGKNVTLTAVPYKKNSPAVIVHSGGTTGIPKSVVLSDLNINYVAWALKTGCIDAKPDDLYYSCIPLFHAFGFVAGIITPLIFKNTLVLAVKYDEDSFIQEFKRVRPNQTMSSSTYLPSFISDPQIQKMDLSFYKNMGMGGTPLAHADEEKIDLFMKNHNSIARPSLGYGMSEVASAACSEMNYYYGKTGSVGIPLCKVNIKAVDVENQTELPYNQEGELYISTPGLMLGYYNDEYATKESIVTDANGEQWIKTGDLGYIDEDGFVFITGRLKRIYTTRTDAKGAIFHIFPDYIADTICSMDSVRECVVVCISDPVLKSIPIAFIVSDSTCDENLSKEVSSFCNNKLPEHSRPKKVFVIEHIPRTPVGKFDYRILEEMAVDLYTENG